MISHSEKEHGGHLIQLISQSSFVSTQCTPKGQAPATECISQGLVLYHFTFEGWIPDSSSTMEQAGVYVWFLLNMGLVYLLMTLPAISYKLILDTFGRCFAARYRLLQPQV